MTGEDPRRALPKVDALLSHPDLAAKRASCGRTATVAAIRGALDRARRTKTAPGLDELARSIADDLDTLEAGRLRSVINATGVVLHTNLGRAPLSDAARRAVDAAAGYCTVEFDLNTGERGKRGTAAHRMLAQLVGTPAAFAVNNTAGALFLALGCLARGREVIVSRGELVEIGGSFRIPEIMSAAGAKLVEVGTTNRTHLRDYATAISERTALLLVVHTSNYRIEGFTARPPLRGLAGLAHEHSVPLLHDVGSGLLNETLGTEPTVADSVRQGADLVAFSGDKLFGGPQAGLLAGRADLIARLARHPVARAVRIDKLTLAALEATLQTHLTGARDDDLPIWRSLGRTPDDIRPRATALAHLLGSAARLREGASVVGGGSLPGENLPTVLLEIDPHPSRETAFLTRLRRADPPVIARTERGCVVLDLRTVAPEQDDVLSRIVLTAFKQR